MPGILYLIVSNHTPSDKLTVLIRGTYISAIILTLVHLFFVLYMPVHEVILLQIGRIWYYPILLSLLASSILFTRLVRSKAIQIALVLIFFLSIHGYRMMARPAFSDGQWLDVQYWAQKNTSIYCSFLVPFSSRGFRSVSERTITGDYKDGALSFYSQDFASEWKHRRDELAQWQKMNENEIQLLEKKYNFDYIVEEIENKKRLPIVYQNSKYIVYDMQGDSQCN